MNALSKFGSEDALNISVQPKYSQFTESFGVPSALVAAGGAGSILLYNTNNIFLSAGRSLPLKCKTTLLLMVAGCPRACARAASKSTEIRLEFRRTSSKLVNKEVEE